MGDPEPLLCATLCAAGAVLLAVPRLRNRRAFLIGWALVSLFLTLGAPLNRLVRGGQVRDYTFAHYHLGARYFDELGYLELYRQTWLAAGEPVGELRDLTTYEVGIASATALPAWSEARWGSFRQDVATLRPTMTDAVWRSWFRDKGYNASPAWTATVGRGVGARPASPGWFAVLGGIDVFMLFLCLGALAATFGGLPALLAAAWIGLFHGSANELLAGPLQVDWLLAATLGVCVLQRGRPWLGGALFGWAVVSRLFPGLLLLGPALALVRPDLRPRVTRFLGGVFLTILLGLTVGATTGRGVDAWNEFGAKIRVHAGQHHLGDQRVGLRPLAAWSPVGDRTDAAARQDRKERWPARAVPAGMAAGVLLALWGAALLRGLRRRATIPLEVLLLLALPVTFLAVASSRYYVLLPALGLLWPHRRSGAALGAALLGSSGVVWVLVTARMPDATVYFAANLAWLTLAAGVMVLWGWGDEADEPALGVSPG